MVYVFEPVTPAVDGDVRVGAGFFNVGVTLPAALAVDAGVACAAGVDCVVVVVTLVL